MDPAAIIRRAKTKKRKRHDIETDHLKLYSHLRNENLHALLIDTAVWLCVDQRTTHVLDCLCLGNLDGGPAMARHVASLLQGASPDVSPESCCEGGRSVRLSLEEAFFLQFALRVLKTFEAEEQHSPAASLEDEALWERCRARRQDFGLLYAAYHHFRSKVGVIRSARKIRF